MTRFLYGDTPGEVITDRAGNSRAGVKLQVSTTRGEAGLTTDIAAGPTGSVADGVVTSDAAGRFSFYGPDGFGTQRLWVRQVGGSQWYALDPDPASLSNTYARQKAQVYGDPTGEPDGTPAELSDGTAVTVFGNAPIVRSGGFYAHDPGSSGANMAGYMQADLGEDVYRIGCEFIAQAGATAAAVTLVLPVGAWQDGLLTNAGVHAVFYPNGIWHVSRFINGGGEANYASDTTVSTYGRFQDMRDGKPHTIEVILDEDKSGLTIVGPDGRAVRASSPYIASETGTFAIWEIFNPNAAVYTSPNIRRVWAGGKTPAGGARDLSIEQAARGLAAYPPIPQVTALPAVGSAQRGQGPVLLRGAVGVADGVYVVMKKADDTYGWVQIG